MKLATAIRDFEAAKQDQATALAAVTAVVRAELEPFVKGRVAAIDELETAIAFIGEAAQPPPAAEDKKKKTPAQPGAQAEGGTPQSRSDGN